MAAQIEVLALDWAKACGLVGVGDGCFSERLWKHLGLGIAVQHCFPYARGIDELVLVAKFLGWFFVLDDALEENGPVHETVYKILVHTCIPMLGEWRQGINMSETN